MNVLGSASGSGIGGRSRVGGRGSRSSPTKDWAVASAACVLGAVAVSPARSETVVVYVFEFDFSTNLPGETITDPTIKVGDTIRWSWLDDHHTTTAALHQSDYWQSDLFDTGDSFEHTFLTPGVFWYYCEPHGFDNGDGTAAGMAGTITVVPAPGGALLMGIIASGPVVLGRRRRRDALFGDSFSKAG